MLPTVEKILCRSLISQRSHVGNLRQTLQGKGEIHKRVETAGVYPLVPPPGRRTPAEVQRKTSRPLEANTPAAVRAPRSAGAEKKPPVRGEHAYAVRVPRSAGAEKPPTRFAFPRLPYTTKTKKAPLTRCLSLLWICRPLSSSSCRNYRSRRRYYHHRYRRNHSRRCPDRSIPRSG